MYEHNSTPVRFPPTYEASCFWNLAVCTSGAQTTGIVLQCCNSIAIQGWRMIPAMVVGIKLDIAAYDWAREFCVGRGCGSGSCWVQVCGLSA